MAKCAACAAETLESVSAREDWKNKPLEKHSALWLSPYAEKGSLAEG